MLFQCFFIQKTEKARKSKNVDAKFNINCFCKFAPELEKSYFDLPLAWAAPKCWLKYTTYVDY